MKNKHTQGEWNAKEGQIYSLETGKTHALIPYFDEQSEEQQANQKLIANAPNMAELLQWIVTEIETTPDELSDALLGMIKLKAQRQLNEL